MFALKWTLTRKILKKHSYNHYNVWFLTLCDFRNHIILKRTMVGYVVLVELFGSCSK